MASACVALAVANSPLSLIYFDVFRTKFAGLSLLHWVNDGLMAIFFLLVGLEIKRELLEGQLSTWSRRILPGTAAAGGMLAPALIYIAVNGNYPENLRGWAIPTATDIAFALGVLALLGSRVPVSLKIFLTAIAIIDDLAAVCIIATFYTSQLSGFWLALSGATLGLLVALNQARVVRLAPYLALGGVLWFTVFQSGVHATLAGVALAFIIPIRSSRGRPDARSSPLHRLEHALQPWVAYLIVPLFGFANAGVSFIGINTTVLFAPVPLGIALGLFAGKQIGVFFTTWLVVTFRWADRPEAASFAQIYGVSLICGIGFTMSLFIGLLAFPSPDLQDGVKIGVLTGSLLSAFIGVLVLFLASRGSTPGLNRPYNSSGLPKGRLGVNLHFGV